MWQELSGLPADRGYSYRQLEKIAAYVRDRLHYSPTEAINTLLLFDGLDIEVRDGTGRDIPIRGGVIELNGSEGYAKYDGDRCVIEILASPETYEWWRRVTHAAVLSLPTSWDTACCILTSLCAWLRCPRRNRLHFIGVGRRSHTKPIRH